MQHELDCWFTTFRTDLGWICVVWQDDAVARLTFGHRTSKQASEAANPQANRLPSMNRTQRDFIERLKDYASGSPQSFHDIPLTRRGFSRFRCQVTDACRRIPWGATRTYSQLAEMAGSRKAARAVGRVMASNPFPLIVPCHRVVAAGGRLGGFSAPDGLKMKQRLLDMESHE